jgi:Ca2+-transporting ATPase
VSPWKILARQFTDLMVLILIGATVVSLAVWWLDGAREPPIDALVIAAIVLLNGGLGFVQEYRAERTLEELKRLAHRGRVPVVREGQTFLVDVEEIVPGDLVLLGEGDRVPCDLVLVEAERLAADESLLTGESVPVAKAPGAVAPEAPLHARTCQLFAGTTLTSGRGKALAVATGSSTEMGGIALSLAQSRSETTPLEARLARLGGQIGWAVLGLSVVMAAIVLAVEGRVDSASLARVLMLSVALAVAAVPEGLPAVLTISLSVGARRLARRQAVARRMSAVETLGSVTVIVTDKTGTLTHNRMTVEEVWVDGRSGLRSGQDPAMELLVAAGVLTGSADLEVHKGRMRPVGDPTDAAFLYLAEKLGVDWRALRRQAPEISAAPFSSERRCASSLRQWRGGLWLFAKGSLEALEACSDSILVNGLVEPLSEAHRRRLRELESGYSDRALRTLALAYRAEAGPGTAEEQERGLVLLGLVAMGDPVRQEVPEAVRQCQEAGIRVIMLTGDHPRTARAVARQIGLPCEQIPLTGAGIEELDEEQLQAELSRRSVFARVSPQTKLRVVEALLRRGEVVAMTGDGVNDAPALRRVHVGVAMGSGTAVAVEASDLVLLDDNFATLVAAVREGRGVYSNIQKFVAFLFSGNFGVVLAMFAGTLLAGAFGLTQAGAVLVPLTAVQILWMNLVTDGLPAVAFSLGRTPPSVMRQPPRPPAAPLLSSRLWAYVALTGSMVAGLLLLVLDVLYPGGWLTLRSHSADLARSAGFYTVVTARLWNALNFRHLTGTVFSSELWQDFYVPGACLLSWLLTLALVTLEGPGRYLGLAALGPPTLLLLTALSGLVVLGGEALRRWARPVP